MLSTDTRLSVAVVFSSSEDVHLQDLRRQVRTQ